MLKVIIADDEPIMLEGLRTMVDWRQMGFEVCGEALDGEDALKLMEACAPQLVVTDIRMPVIDGLELIERASIQFPGTRFIILSGYADFQYARRAMRYGVSNYLTKPLDERELEEAVKQVGIAIQAEQARKEERRRAMIRLQTETVSRLLLGDYHTEELAESLSLKELNECSSIRCIQIMHGQALSLHKLQAAADTARIEGASVYPYALGSARYGYVLATDSRKGSLALSTLQHFIEHVREALEETLQFSVSSEHRGSDSLNRAYQEALAAEICRFPSKQPGVYYYQEKAMQEAAPIPAATKEALLQAIGSGGSGKAASLAQEIFTLLTANTASEAWVQACAANLKLEILQILIQHGADGESWTRRWFEAAPVRDLGALEERFVKELRDAAEWMEAEKGSRVDAVVAAAADYVRTHAHEKLQLQHVAEHLHVNPAYLGQRFKKQMGIAFNEFLHTVRIEEAKKLLRRAELKISDIASRVGYSDTDQFVAKFKALTGMLPSSYKKG